MIYSVLFQTHETSANTIIGSLSQRQPGKIKNIHVIIVMNTSDNVIGAYCNVSLQCIKNQFKKIALRYANIYMGIMLQIEGTY